MSDGCNLGFCLLSYMYVLVFLSRHKVLIVMHMSNYLAFPYWVCYLLGLNSNVFTHLTVEEAYFAELLKDFTSEFFIRLYYLFSYSRWRQYWLPFKCWSCWYLL